MEQLNAVQVEERQKQWDDGKIDPKHLRITIVLGPEDFNDGRFTPEEVAEAIGFANWYGCGFGDETDDDNRGVSLFLAEKIEEFLEKKYGWEAQIRGQCSTKWRSWCPGQ